MSVLLPHFSVGTPSTLNADGLLRCSRYAFGPNRLHYCGPDASQEILSYLHEGASDPGLAEMLKKFGTLFPYLRFIAHANRIADPFDPRVVDAYWIGNTLLDAVDMRAFYRHLDEDLQLKKKIGRAHMERLGEKLKRRALPHHSFHVFNIWKRTGHAEEPHTLESMDACRISWGRVSTVDGPYLSVAVEPLILNGRTLLLGEPVLRTIVRSLTANADIENVHVGDTISLHWGVPCEVLNDRQVARLKRYTARSVGLANQML